MPDFKIIEITGDLFSCGSDFSICHCVPADLRIGDGIAIKIRNKYGQLEELEKQNVQPGGVGIIKHGRIFLYYLITKPTRSAKPTYQILQQCLAGLHQHMVENHVRKLALPRVCCGLEGLDWNRVKEMIIDIFKVSDMELNVYYNDAAH